MLSLEILAIIHEVIGPGPLPLLCQVSVGLVQRNLKFDFDWFLRVLNAGGQSKISFIAEACASCHCEPGVGSHSENTGRQREGRAMRTSEFSVGFCTQTRSHSAVSDQGPLVPVTYSIPASPSMSQSHFASVKSAGLPVSLPFHSHCPQSCGSHYVIAYGYRLSILK